MMPHINELSRRRNAFWRGLTKTVLVILAGAVVPITMALVALIWRFL